MNSGWQIDLFTGLERTTNMQDVLDVAQKTIKPFGFDFCGWRSKLPLPMAHKHYSLMHSGEDAVSRLEAQGRYDNAPVPHHCSQSMDPIAWCGTTDEPTFLLAPELWEEYYAEGHFGGWAQSLVESKNMFSMLYVDSKVPLQRQDLEQVDYKMQWVATAVLSKINQLRLTQRDVTLTPREEEVLRWIGDGKTAEDIGAILSISHSTVNYHLRNVMHKLEAPNKTTAVVRAIYLGLLRAL